MTDCNQPDMTSDLQQWSVVIHSIVHSQILHNIYSSIVTGQVTGMLHNSYNSCNG